MPHLIINPPEFFGRVYYWNEITILYLDGLFSLERCKESMQSGQGFSLDSIRKAAEEKIFAAVDGVVNRIPNGQQYKDQFRQAISGAMDDLQRQAQSQLGNLGNMMGNLGGMTGRRPDQGNPPVH